MLEFTCLKKSGKTRRFAEVRNLRVFSLSERHEESEKVEIFVSESDSIDTKKRVFK